jgi:hypothetical protein
MQRSLLNLALLRGHTPTPTTDPSSSPATTDPDHDRRDVSLSRRRLMSVGGIAAIGFTPLVRALGATIRNDFDVVATPDRVSFLVHGDERWTIDAARFAGSPKLSYARNGDDIDIALAGARYPGTDVTADFECTVRRGIGGWEMKLEHALGHFRAEAPFTAWLAGTHTLESTVELDASLCRLADGTELVGRGVAAGRLTPNWSMAFAGEAIASYEGLGAPLASDALRVSLLETESASVLTMAAAKRSLIELERGEREWRPELPERITGGLRLSMTSSPFDQISIESGESHRGERSHAIVAEGTTTTPALMVHPCSGFGGAVDAPAGLPLRHAR